MTQVLEHREFNDINIEFPNMKWHKSLSTVTIKRVEIGQSISNNVQLAMLLHEVGHVKTTIQRYRDNNTLFMESKTTRQCELRASGWALRFARQHHPTRYKAVRRLMSIGYNLYIKRCPL